MDRVVIGLLLVLLSWPAEAQTKKAKHHENWDVTPLTNRFSGLTSSELTVVGIAFCMPVNLMISAAIMDVNEGRELRLSEAHEIVAGCLLPVIGPAIVRRLYQEHPEWNDLPTGPRYTRDVQMRIW